MSTRVIKMTKSHKTLQNAMNKKKGKAAKMKGRNRCQNDEMKDRMRIIWTIDWGQTYRYPTIFMTFLDESKLPQFQKSEGINPPFTPVAPPLGQSLFPFIVNNIFMFKCTSCIKIRYNYNNDKCLCYNFRINYQLLHFNLLHLHFFSVSTLFLEWK